VNATGQARGASLTRRQRVLSAGIGVGLVAMLGVAVALRPSERGWGTHQQLGLPPCTFQWMFGQRCPSCGMTTSWAWLVRGNAVRAAKANVGGTLLAAAALVAAPWLLVSAIRGRWLVTPPGDGVLAVMAIVVVVITLIDWGLRLATG
jgi:Protein of unknown function (DUF2752)